MLGQILSAASILQPRTDDDLVDRLSYYYTTTLMIIFALVVSFRHFVGKPIECWVDASYRPGWEEYAETYCWAQNTYWLPFDKDIPEDYHEREKLQISYYQWIPFFLLLQALFFYIPCILWRMGNDESGFNISDIVQLAADKKNLNTEEKRKNIKILAEHFENVTQHQRISKQRHRRQGHFGMHNWARCLNLPYHNYYLITIYLLVKFFYLVNVVGQLLVMNWFLQTERHVMYGFGAVRDMIAGHQWESSGVFPRVTLCDFDIRLLGNVQRHSVQCVLFVNLFTEKVFIVLWLWFFLLTIMTAFSFCSWFAILVLPSKRIQFLMRHLDEDEPDEYTREHKQGMRTRVRNFLENYVQADGIFVLKMISGHAGVVFCTELVDAMWTRFKKQQGGNGAPKEFLLNADAMKNGKALLLPPHDPDQDETSDSNDKQNC